MDQSEVIQFLYKTDIFSGLRPEDFNCLEGSCHERVFEDGALVVEEGRPATFVYVIVDGEVTREGPGPPSDAPTPHPDQGSLVGLTALSGFARWSASLRAKGRVRAIEIPLSELKQMLQRDPGAGFVVMKRVAAKLPTRV